MSSRGLSIVVPTYGRDEILLETLKRLFALNPPASEIIVIDQTEKHTSQVSGTLHSWQASGWMRWLRLRDPSIPGAMNCGLLEAKLPVVLFLDDDIIPQSGLVEAHTSASEETGATLVAGRVIQPWQEGVDFSGDNEFHFASCRPFWINEFMAGNFSVRRDMALKVGGFDERFVRVAYNFEAEFAYRWRKAGHRIYFEPTAAVHHLRVAAGGTRMFGEHLRSFRPNHAVGAYYYFLRTWSGRKSIKQLIGRPLRAISTRHHLRRPWWIPATLIAEFLGMAWALVLAVRGPSYVRFKGGRAQSDA
jgi:GT2 family glycosyltransferase